VWKLICLPLKYIVHIIIFQSFIPVSIAAFVIAELFFVCLMIPSSYLLSCRSICTAIFPTRYSLLGSAWYFPPIAAFHNPSNPSTYNNLWRCDPFNSRICNRRISFVCLMFHSICNLCSRSNPSIYNNLWQYELLTQDFDYVHAG